MNKHQYRAIATAIIGLIASFALWTSYIGWLPLPSISQSTVTLLDTILSDLAQTFSAQEELTVQEVTVESLGTHFAEAVERTSIQATVVSNFITHTVQVEQEPEPEQEEPVEVAEEVVQEELHQAPSQPQDELEQWELIRAWNIVIPSLSIRAPVLLPSMHYWSLQAWDLLEEQMQVGLNHGAVAYPHSVNPGQNGSLIIAGHSSPPDERAEQSAYGNLFARLPDVEIGSEIEVDIAGSNVTYVVEDKQIVSPKMTTILEQQSEESILKLITCYPVGTTRDRMIITARRMEQ